MSMYSLCLTFCVLAVSLVTFATVAAMECETHSLSLPNTRLYYV